MDSAPSSPRRAPAVGRGHKMRTAVLDAAVIELSETGYAALTVERVAQRAGVHKTTVYRNWKDSDSLVADALTSHFAEHIPVPDTGTVDGDLCELARTLVATMNAPAGRALLTAVLSDAVRIPALAEVKRALFHDRFSRASVVVTRGVERGELPADTDPAELLKTLAAPLYFRLVFTDEPVDESTAERAARVALAAARTHLLAPA